MKTRTFLPVAAALFAAFTSASHTFAQSANVKTPNKNLSAKFKSAIFKGSGNLIESNSIASFIGGGQSNTIFAGLTNGVIGGGSRNTVSNQFGTVAGGLANAAGGHRATVGGGGGNRASGEVATVAGGIGNTADGQYAFVGGGDGNRATSGAAAVSGGVQNTAGGEAASIGGGSQNLAGDFATVGGGGNNEASGFYSTIPGGTQGKATNQGAFVWNGLEGVVTASTNNNSFTVRAPGGVRFISTLVDSTTIGPVLNGNNGVFLAPNSGAWASLSDSNAKTKVTAVKPREILSKVASIPVTEWEYKADPNRRYIGPMAQDFHAAFGLGRDDKSITTLDSDGVMYAAIQGLVEELKERDKAIDELKAKLESLEQRLDALPPAP